MSIGREGARELVSGVAVSPTFVETTGLVLERGRSFAAAEYRPDGACVVVLSQALASSVAGDRDPVGLTTELDESPCTIVGVAPEDFVMPAGAKFLIPRRGGQ
jgi:hypothetical protein